MKIYKVNINNLVNILKDIENKGYKFVTLDIEEENSTFVVSISPSETSDLNQNDIEDNANENSFNEEIIDI